MYQRADDRELSTTVEELEENTHEKWCLKLSKWGSFTGASTNNNQHNCYIQMKYIIQVYINFG